MSQASCVDLPLEISTVRATEAVIAEDMNGGNNQFRMNQSDENASLYAMGIDTNISIFVDNDEGEQVTMMNLSQSTGVIIGTTLLTVGGGIAVHALGINFTNGGGGIQMNPTGCPVRIYTTNLPQIEAGKGAGVLFIDPDTNLVSVSTD